MKDINIFENGWTDWNAYIYGWILTDGCLKKEGRNKTSYAVRVCSNDKEIIEWMHKTMCVGNSIYKEGKNYSIKFRDLDSIKFMMDNKLVERKSLTLDFPEIPDEFLPTFIRGVFDGDGSVILRITKYNLYGQISFTSGSDVFLRKMQKRLLDVGIDSRVYQDGRAGKNCSYLRIIKRSEIEKFFHFLYENENVPRLERKYAKYKTLIDTPPKYNVSKKSA